MNVTYQDFTHSTRAKGNVRILRQQEELPLLRDHLLRLDRVSRHDRFQASWMTASSNAMPRNAPTMARIIIAYFENGVGARAAELHPPDQSPDALPEIAFSVEASVRRQGVGSILFKKADRGSTIEGLSRLADHDGCAETTRCGRLPTSSGRI